MESKLLLWYVLRAYELSTERVFLSPKEKGSGRGVKENEVGFDGCSSSKSGNTTYMKSDQNKGDAIASGNVSTIGNETTTDHDVTNDEPMTYVVSPAVADEQVVKEKQDTSVDTCSLNVENTSLKSYPPLPTQGSTPAGNTPGMSLYANVTSVPSRKALNIHTLYTPGGNGVDVVVPVESIRAVSERFANTSYGFFLGKRMAYPVVANYVRNTWRKYDQEKSMLNSSIRSNYARAMIKLKAYAELRDTIMVAMPKLTGEGNLVLVVAKNMKKPSQAPKGFPVGSKVRFKPAKEYKLVPKKPTANTSGNKKHDVEPTKQVSNSNPFDVLNSVENDVDLSTNGGTSNLVSKESNSSGSSFWNVESSTMSTTPIVEKIRNIKKLIMDGKATLVDDEGVPVKKVDYLSDYDSKDEVALVDNDMARSMALEKGGFGTTSLLEQWRDSYENGDYKYDPYDDDMYEG
ncbi:hypothetical protein Tco_0604171 [Tanacetum coccineum]